MRHARLLSSLAGWASLFFFLCPLVLRIVGSALGMQRPAGFGGLAAGSFVLAIVLIVGSGVLLAFERPSGPLVRIHIGDEMRPLGLIAFVVLTILASALVAASAGDGPVSRVVAIAWLVGCVGAFVAMWAVTAAPVVTIGVDGVLVRQRSSERFYPFSSLESARIDGASLVLRMRDDREERVLTLRSKSLERVAALGTIIHHIDEALALSEDSLASRLLDRDGRSFDAWRAHLSSLLRSRTSYRDKELTRGLLTRLLAEPRTSAEHRIAAALALDDNTRTRLAAESCADVRLRVALNRIAEGAADDRLIDRAARPEPSVGVSRASGQKNP